MIIGRYFKMQVLKELVLFLAILGVNYSYSQAEQVLGEKTYGSMNGYLMIGINKVPETYDAGFSTYVAAWPLLKKYPGNSFQTGLLGTWMHPSYNDVTKPDRKLYNDIEGGLGWWRDTRFATETPKFIMGGVALNFSAWANGPGAGKGRDWDKPNGKYGVAQLSPWVLWPPDGLNLKQGTNGELFGYGYLPLPLIDAKSTTAGKNVPTGDNTWTLFLNTVNFKGPVAFFTPYFFSKPIVDEPELAGMFLDTRPGKPNKPIQMETQHIPSAQYTDSKGDVYARVAPTSFPSDVNGESMLIHQVTAYKKSALWDAVKLWFDNDGPAVSGAINTSGAAVHTFKGKAGSSWKIYPENAPKTERWPIDWKSIATPLALDSITFGYQWNEDLVKLADTGDGALMALPEYYRLEEEKGGKPHWVAVEAKDVPTESGFDTISFTSTDKQLGAYFTPEDSESSWKKPGPVAGPFKTKIGDGSTVTYYWYRFVDQPALLNADLSDAEREVLQGRIVKLHKNWTKEKEYLPAPRVGKLANIDPALIVSPPIGMEAGYVPIVTQQGLEE